MADFADSTPLQTLTEPDGARRSLTPAQEFRVRIARNDLERVREFDLDTLPASGLLPLVGALRSSLLNVLQVVEDLTEGES